MIRKILALIFGEWCDIHERAYYSDFCPSCIRERMYRNEVTDSRPEWTRSEGSWPIKVR